MGASRAKQMWERFQTVLAAALGAVLIANAAVVLGKTTLGGVAVAAGLVVLAVLAALTWRIEPRRPARAVVVAALTGVLFGCLAGLLIGSLTAIPPIDPLTFETFDTTQAVLFGVIGGGGQAWIRWIVFQQVRRDRDLAGAPERSP